MYVVPYSEDFAVEEYRVLDFAAYYRAVRLRLEKTAAENRRTYPEPKEHWATYAGGGRTVISNGEKTITFR